MCDKRGAFSGVLTLVLEPLACMQGITGAAYRLTPSQQQTDGAATNSALNLITNKGGVGAKLNSY